MLEKINDFQSLLYDKIQSSLFFTKRLKQNEREFRTLIWKKISIFYSFIDIFSKSIYII